MISRYSVKKINDIFSDKRKYENWLKIELLLLRYLSGIGYLKKKDVEDVEKEVVVYPDQIREEEKRIKHDVAAFVNCISRTVISDKKKWIHYGLTSSDLVDTGNAMALKEANEVVIEHAYKILRRLKYLSYKHKKTYYLKREGGEIVGIGSFGHMISRYYSSMKEFIASFTKLRPHVECVSLSGSVGTCSYLGTELQEFVAKELDLFSVPISTQVVSRDRYYSYFSLLAYMGQVMNGLSLELRLLTRTEIGEVAEAFEKKQIGSSSMPHKRNPITLENICGLSRLLDGYLNASSKNSLIWFERDISHSSADRVLFIDAISIAVQIMKRMTSVLESLYVNVDQMEENVAKNRFNILKPKLTRFLMERRKVFTLQEADYCLEEINRHAKKFGNDFREEFEKSFGEKGLSKVELEGLFNFEDWFRHLDGVYRRIFGDSMERSDFEIIHYEQAQISYCIELLAQRLNYEYRNYVDPIYIISPREGCSIFLSQLLPKLKFSVELRTFGTPMVRKQKIKRKMEIDLDKKVVKNRNVLILEELFEKGGVLEALKDYVIKHNAISVRTCVLFYPRNEEISKYVDFYGLALDSSKNVAGFGLEVGGRYRNLNYIGRVKEINID